MTGGGMGFMIQPLQRCAKYARRRANHCVEWARHKKPTSSQLFSDAPIRFVNRWTDGTDAPYSPGQFGRRADGSFVSEPLEDLWPFLDRNEFAANMIVEPVGE